MDNFWKLGNEFRGQSKFSEDHQWSIITSKLAEMTKSKFDRMNNVDCSRNAFETKPYEKFCSQEDNKIENLNLSLMNLNLKMNETLIKGPISTPYSVTNLYQQSNVNDLNNFKLNTYISHMSNNEANNSSTNSKSIISSIIDNIDSNSANGDHSGDNAALDKRFKTLPAAEMLPRNVILGGYIFVCNNDTMQEDLKRQLFGLPPRYRDSVRAITPGLPLFLYNYTTHQLHGIFEASSFGGSNIDPTAWEDKKCKGESRFPAQVRIRVRNVNIASVENYVPTIEERQVALNEAEIAIPDSMTNIEGGRSSPSPGRDYVNKAHVVVSTVLAKGSAFKQDALTKAKAFDEKHKLSATASERVISFDRRVGLSEKFNVGISIVNEKVKSVDQKLHVSDKTMAAIIAAERKLNDTGTAVKTNRNILVEWCFWKGSKGWSYSRR